ncbi:hypothetical protein D3C79_1007420 [compost metagenome]
MPGCFEAINGNHISAVAFSGQGMPDRSALMDNFNPLLLQSGYHGLGIVAGGLDDANITVDDGLDPAVVIHIAGGQR